MRIVLWVCCLLFLLQKETAQAQANCYSEQLCQGPATVVSTIEECCLTSDGVTLAGGMTYDTAGEACQTCVVFGWRAGFSFVASEQGEAYSLAVGYIKGADRAPGNGRLRFNVEDTLGTATEGASNDYRVSNTQNLDVRRNRDATVQVTFRVDNVALEPDETLALTLVPQNELAMAGDSNVFLLETIQLTIQDSDVVTFQFSESDYRTREEEGILPVMVDRNYRIATDVTLRITPVNFTQVNVTGFVFPDDFPDLREFDPIRPIIAKGLPEDERDFNITPIEVTFPRDEINNSADMDAPVSVFDDELNEADEVFVVLLEVVSDVPLVRVNLVPRNASLCWIVDNDPINIGFEFPRYDFEEQFITFTTESSPVFIIKENNRESEQTFEVVITAGPAQVVYDATPVEAATPDNPPDYEVASPQTFIFRPDEDRIPVPFRLFDDFNPELLEGFLLSSSPSELSPPFLTGTNPTTTIAITDDDPHVNCYSQRQCQGPATSVRTIRECCLTNDNASLAEGVSYDSTEMACQTCIVFGWIAGFNFQASEQGEAYSLEVGYLKGADRAPGNGRLRFDIERTARASNDYRVSNTQNLDVRPTRDAMVQVTFRVDNVALEPDENLTLTLVPQNTLAMALGSNVFLLETIQLTIQDSDEVSFQFTESEYRAREEEETVPVRVERNLRIATDVTLRITPVNFTQVNFTGFPFPEDFPDVPQFDPTRPIIAKSLLEDASDFSIDPIEVTFPRDEISNSADRSVPIVVYDDEVNEADEVFVVLLEVVTNVPLARVNLVPQNASVCRIVDDDPINIGFELSRYDFVEQSRQFTSANTPVFLIKENNRTSEQTFDVVVTAGPAQDPGVEDATPVEAATPDNPPDYRVVSLTTYTFEPDEQKIPIVFQLFADTHPESTEHFLLGSSPSEQSPPFQSGANPSTTIAIIDTDVIYFQLRLAMEHCTTWSQQNRRDVVESLQRQLVQIINDRCNNCNFTVISFGTAPQLSCHNTPTHITYRNTITGSTSYRSRDVVGYIEEWIATSPSVAIDILIVNVDSTCAVRISSLNEPECSVPDTLPRDQILITRNSAAIECMRTCLARLPSLG